MTGSCIEPAALLRGTAAGSLTAALAVAAHGAGGGALPSGAVAAQLAVLTVTLGAVAATVTAASRSIVLCALLGTGQLLAHALLTVAAGHPHGADPLPPGPAMLIAHLVAVSVGAFLIAGGARLCATMSRVVRAAARPRRLPVVPTPVWLVGADQPPHSALFLAASVSHRGPPVFGIA